MPEIKHTPGPWVLASSNSWRRILGPRSVAVLVPTTQGDDHPDLFVSDADAKLMMAAPDLLAALEALTADRLFYFEGDTTGEMSVTVAAYEAARAAIDKATE